MSHLDQALARLAASRASTASVTSADAASVSPVRNGASAAAVDDDVPWDIDEASLNPPPPSGAKVPSPPVTSFAGAGATGAARVVHLPTTNAAERLILAPALDSRCVEEYRRVTAILHLTQATQNIKTLIVASAVPGEGKTLTSTNVALTLSESYRRRVLLIDADLRRPSLHELFGVPNVSGLNDGLKSATDGKLSLMRLSDTLTLMTAGRPDSDPMSALTSGRMKRLLEEAAAAFDWVVIDTPPVDLLPDAHLLAAMVDAVLLVVRAGRTAYPAVMRTVEALGRERIVGVVLNRAVGNVKSREEYAYYYAQPGNAQTELVGRDS